MNKRKALSGITFVLFVVLWFAAAISGSGYVVRPLEGRLIDEAVTPVLLALMAAVLTIPGFLLYRRVDQKIAARWADGVPAKKPVPRSRAETIKKLLERFKRWRERRRNRFGRLISTPRDFRNVRVYERPTTGLPVYTIAFRNREQRMIEDTLRGVGLALWIVPLMLFSVLGAIIAIFLVMGAIAKPGQPIPPDMLAWAVAGVFCTVFVAPRAWRPVRKLRIVLDPVRDEIRVMHGRKVRIRHSLDLASTSVEEHPRAMVDRVDRAVRNEKKPGPFEKQHCLVGWFGIGGGERVELVCRYEWPNRMSLMEVQQALGWVSNRLANWNFDGARTVEGPGPQPLAPPLD